MHVVQVDERIAPAGDPDRNLTHLRESLLEHAPLPADHIYAMPVEAADLDAAARSYARTLERIAGTPPVLDLAHLGLGPDGHTASLVPDDPVLDVADRDVALTGVYMKRRRMTLTYPMLDRSRRILWLVTGAEKAAMLPRLRAADSLDSRRARAPGAALVLADRAAAGGGSSTRRRPGRAGLRPIAPRPPRATAPALTGRPPSDCPAAHHPHRRSPGPSGPGNAARYSTGCTSKAWYPHAGRSR